MKQTMIFIISLIVVVVISCRVAQNKWMPYNREQWMYRDGHFHLRGSMVRDVMKNHLHKGMTIGEVLEMLPGAEKNFSPQDSIQLVYEIEVNYVFHDIDPRSGKNLYVSFTPDSLVSNFHLKEWKSGE